MNIHLKLLYFTISLFFCIMFATVKYILIFWCDKNASKFTLIKLKLKCQFFFPAKKTTPKKPPPKPQLSAGVLLWHMRACWSWTELALVWNPGTHHQWLVSSWSGCEWSPLWSWKLSYSSTCLTAYLSRLGFASCSWGFDGRSCQNLKWTWTTTVICRANNFLPKLIRLFRHLS